MRDLQHDTCSVAGLVVCALSASVLHVFQDAKRAVHQLVRFVAMDVDDHAYAAGIVLVGGIIESSLHSESVIHINFIEMR